MAATRRTRIVLALTLVYVVFFSLPIAFFWYAPMWDVYPYGYVSGLVVLLRVLAFLFSPVAFLAMGIVCYAKRLRVRTYVASAMFVWVIMLQISLFLFGLLLEHIPRYIPHWP